MFLILLLNITYNLSNHLFIIKEKTLVTNFQLSRGGKKDLDKLLWEIETGNEEIWSWMNRILSEREDLCHKFWVND